MTLSERGMTFRRSPSDQVLLELSEEEAGRLVLAFIQWMGQILLRLR